jgi:hypothetical protein
VIAKRLGGSCHLLGNLRGTARILFELEAISPGRGSPALSPDRTCKPIPWQPAATYLAEHVPLFPVVVFSIAELAAPDATFFPSLWWGFQSARFIEL